MKKISRRVFLQAAGITAAAGALAACGSGASASTGASAASSSAASSAAGSGASAAAGAYTIKLASVQGDVSREESGEVDWYERFKEEVEDKSKGAITVDVYPSGQLGSADESVTGLLNGSLEMTCVNISVLNNVYQDTMVLSCPALFRDEDECDAILTGDWGTQFFSQMATDSGIRILSAFCNGMRDFTTTDTPLTTVDTAKGVTFRVMQSEVCEKMVEAIGANPVPMAGSEMYTALQNGTVDGQENPPVNILNDKTYEVQKYMVLDKHIASIVTFAIAEDYFQKLPSDLQKVVTDAAAAVTPEAEEICAKLNTDGVEKLKGYGLSIYEPTAEELQAWHDAMRQPCIDFVTQQLGADVVNGLLDAIKKQEA
jgi:tripartite ATP-independent transporter DctP family solute receptor